MRWSAFMLPRGFHQSAARREKRSISRASTDASVACLPVIAPPRVLYGLAPLASSASPASLSCSARHLEVSWLWFDTQPTAGRRRAAGGRLLMAWRDEEARVDLIRQA